MTTNKKVIIVGAGPAGLTAALELLKRGVKPIILEKTSVIGGISQTVVHNGNRMDIGGHRFFSKSAWVMQWWQEAMKLPVPGEAPAQWLKRNRLSRIYYLRQFFDYPRSLTKETLSKLGMQRLFSAGVSYTLAKVFPKVEHSLEDFFINRFGKQLYLTFFKDYTEKVWGVPCDTISPDWGAQRIKSLSAWKAAITAVKSVLGIKDTKQATSLIEQFNYPEYGPGQLWERVAAYIETNGGQILRNTVIHSIVFDEAPVMTVSRAILHTEIPGVGTEEHSMECAAIFSSMPIVDLVNSLSRKNATRVPFLVTSFANKLQYRDFITIGVKVRKDITARLPDNWIYIQEPDVKLGRVQVFNNWSPSLVKEEGTTWLGLEYFCQEGDEFWTMEDTALIHLAIKELAHIGLISVADALPGECCVVRMPKAYPAYFGAYSEFWRIQEFLDTLPNVYPMGRNGMHRYNNQDHSMLTAKHAVEAYFGEQAKADGWLINVDDDYHEEDSSK